MNNGCYLKCFLKNSEFIVSIIENFHRGPVCNILIVMFYTTLEVRW